MPKTTTAKLKAKLDKIFSEYIRLRDSDHKGNCKCISCGKEALAFGGSIHAGHFMSRRHLATRYDEKNVNSQCSYCNTFLNGNQYRASIGINNKYGNGTAEELEKRSKTIIKLSRVDYEEAIANIKEKIKQLTNDC
tara:strand:+ start:700 stop:1107 length:408 start_codon:yes stop_codon:yes gene_type:complete